VSTLLRCLGEFYFLSFIIKMEQKIIEKLHGFFNNVVTCNNGKCQVYFFFHFHSELHNWMMSTGGYLMTTSVINVVFYVPFITEQLLSFV
jgi:hypothetical protein